MSWFQLSAIGALVVGSVYVLLPTLVAEPDTSVDVAEEVQTEGTLEAWLTTPDGDPDAATADVLTTRLRGMGLGFDRAAVEDEKIVVYLRPGTPRDDVLAAASFTGVVKLHALSDAGVQAGALGADPDATLRTALKDVAVTAEALPDLRPGTFTAGADGAVTFTTEGTWPAGGAPLVLTVDGTSVGWATPGEGGVGVVHLADTDRKAGLNTGLLLSGPLPEPLSRVEVKAAEKAEKVEQAAPVAWWHGLLPDTRMNLGLDLQGGIDLTLQVDQDAAVAAQVTRDRTMIRDQALRDNVTIEVSRDRSRPALRFVSGDELSTLREYLAKYLRDYVYTETLTEDDKTWHVFSLQDERVDQIKAQAVEQVLETLRKRVDSTGVKEPAIVQMPGGRISIQLPGVKDTQSAVDAVGTEALLEFRLVDHDADPMLVQRLVEDARRELPPEQFEDDQLVNEWLREQKKMPEDRLILWNYGEDPEGKLVREEALQLVDQVLLTGGDINNAGVGWDQNNQPNVMMEFKPQGARIFCDVTTANVQKRFAIILDGQIRSAPNIKEPICGGSASIEMGGSADSMRDSNTLALVLRTGSLTAPVNVGEVRNIGPNLGRDAIRSGIIGSLVGGAITMTFMLLWYRRAGAVAVVALSLNVLLVFAALALFGATLTLPGIAGVALTIGMAVDCNIIVFERIREELALGVSARKAVETGFDKGAVAVIDSNLTTAIAGIVLYSYGTGPIKGFAVTLLVGIVTTIITGVYVTRALLEMLTRNSDAELRI